MSKLYALIALILFLAGCGGGVTGPCPDPNPDPTSACAWSHGKARSG